MPDKPVKRKVGRPSKYNSERDVINQEITLDVIYKLAKYHLTDAEMSDILGVSEVTWNAWKKNHPEFLKSLKEGKEESNATVQNSLYQRAVGYSHKEEKIFCTNGIVTKVDTVRHYPPSEVAMIFWLKNRDPENWRDRQEIEHSGGIRSYQISEDFLPKDPEKDD